ncbi:MAG TPA: hypothetical protein VFE47_05715 [Tepidisphaeraceae bacterium]|nr:hypothetical protein [Tepidisphaeraceae bacterium]
MAFSLAEFFPDESRLFYRRVSKALSGSRLVLGVAAFFGTIIRDTAVSAVRCAFRAKTIARGRDACRE